MERRKNEDENGGEVDEEDEDGSDISEEITTDNYNYNMVLKKVMKEKELYKNDRLKGIICKYKYKQDKIDTIFIEMKITDKTPITKELISKIILRLGR